MNRVLIQYKDNILPFTIGIHIEETLRPYYVHKGFTMLLRHFCIEKTLHDDVIKWKYFPRYWPFLREIHRWPVDSPHKGQWRGAWMFSLICAWTNGWENNRGADYLRHHRTHYDLTAMIWTKYKEPGLMMTRTCVTMWRHKVTASYQYKRQCYSQTKFNTVSELLLLIYINYD